MRPLWDPERRLDQLQAALAAGDVNGAQEAAWALYKGRVEAFLQRAGLPVEQVDDSTARVILHASERAARDGVDFPRFEGFLLNGARYEAMTWRKARNREHANRQKLATADVHPQESCLVTALSAQQDLHTLLAALSPIQRTILRGMLDGVAEDVLLRRVERAHGESLTPNALRLRKSRLRRLIPLDWGTP